MNTQKKYVYAMQPTALAGAPMMVAYEVDETHERPSEVEVVRAQQRAALVSRQTENVSDDEPGESFTQAIRRFTRQKLWRTRVAA
tara:strand:- start:26 stop:280 length:255 start_codon:yes stop_codon:yes gene_type:complete